MKEKIATDNTKKNHKRNTMNSLYQKMIQPKRNGKIFRNIQLSRLNQKEIIEVPWWPSG